jgi:hypothetical protein
MELPKVIICDIDGTLALLGDRNRYDPTTGNDILNDPIANILQVYNNQTVFPIKLILVTGREEKYRKFTEKWLNENRINHYNLLLMRKTGDFRKDFIIKKELYDKYIKGKYNVLFVLEDRDQVVKMWRDEGLVCLQVAYGNF